MIFIPYLVLAFILWGIWIYVARVVGRLFVVVSPKPASKLWLFVGVLLGVLIAYAGVGLLLPSISRYAAIFIGVALWPVWCVFGFGISSLWLADQVLGKTPQCEWALVLHQIGKGSIYAIPTLTPLFIQFANQIVNSWNLTLTFTP